MSETATDLTAWLDELDRLRAEATPGEWTATNPRADGGAYIDARPARDNGWPPWVGHATREHDAALIVAAVNAVPRLVAAARAALALVDELSEPLRPAGTWGEGYDDARTDTAARLRSVLAAALTPAPPVTDTEAGRGA